MYSGGAAPKDGGPPYWKCSVKAREDWQKRYRADPRKQNDRVQAWRDAHPTKAKINALIQSRIRLTVREYEALLEACDGRCEICGDATNPKRGSKTLCVDHDHDTGVVRGLLCRRCNSAIGLFGDDPNLIANALFYLEARG